MNSFQSKHADDPHTDYPAGLGIGECHSDTVHTVSVLLLSEKDKPMFCEIMNDMI